MARPRNPSVVGVVWGLVWGWQLPRDFTKSVYRPSLSGP